MKRTGEVRPESVRSENWERATGFQFQHGSGPYRCSTTGCDDAPCYVIVSKRKNRGANKGSPLSRRFCHRCANLLPSSLRP